MFRKPSVAYVAPPVPQKKSYERMSITYASTEDLKNAYEYLASRTVELLKFTTTYHCEHTYTMETGFCSLRGADKKARVYAIQSNGWVIIETIKQTGINEKGDIPTEEFHKRFAVIPTIEALMRYIHRDEFLTETDRLEKVEKELAELQEQLNPKTKHYDTLDQAFAAAYMRTVRQDEGEQK